jgi:hypothetical protein
MLNSSCCYTHASKFLIFLTILFGFSISVGFTNSIDVSSHDNSTSITIESTTGELVSISSPQSSLSLAPLSGSYLSLNQDCKALENSTTVVSEDGNVIVTRILYCESKDVNVTLIDTYAPSAMSVMLTSSYIVSTPTPTFTYPFGFDIVSPTLANNSSPLSFWTTWTRGCVNNGPGMCFSSGPWLNPFLPTSLPVSNNLLFKLGDPLYDGGILGPLGDKIDDTITIPLVTLMNENDNFGATILLAPTDHLLQVLLQVNMSDVRFVRMLRRFSTGVPINVTMHIRAHDSDWRPALELLLNTFPSFVLPHAVNASDFDGLGGYSWVAPVNETYANEVGFKTNWELSGTFMPYDGLFAPYQEEWLNLGPINAGLPQYNVTYGLISTFDYSVQAAGLNSLSYFDVGNWGVSIDTSKSWPNETCGVRPDNSPAPCPTPEGSNSFLQHFLSDSLLNNGWRMGSGFVSSAISDWVGTTLMDPSEPFFEDLLVEQLERRMGLLVPTAQGIALDRFDYTGFYSFKRDDNISWIPQPGGGGEYGPAQSFLESHIHTYSRLAAVLRSTSPTKVMFGNCNTLCRIDLSGIFDGGFNEGAALNAVAWTGIRRPTILWTYSLDSLSQVELDAYFQQHILMRVFPMAPMPGNDHSINPSSALIQQAYQDYSSLFFALRGCDWALSISNPITVSPSNSNVISNLFRATRAEPGAILAVFVLGETTFTNINASIAIGESGSNATSFDAFSLVPGSSTWNALGQIFVQNRSTVLVQVPLSRGCGLLRLVPSAFNKNGVSKGDIDFQNTAVSSGDIITVTVGTSANVSGLEIPHNFVSLSVEVNGAVAFFGNASAPNIAYSNLMNVLRNVSKGRGPTIRIGGGSADRSLWWPDASLPLPPNQTYAITEHDLLSYQTALPTWNGRGVIDTNFFIQGTNATATQRASDHALAISNTIGWSLIEGVEVGNEVECYHDSGYRPKDWDESDYENEFVAHVAALLAAGMPKGLIQGAVFCCNNTEYNAAFSKYTSTYTRTGDLASVSYHHYSVGGCEGKNVTLDMLMADEASIGSATFLAPFASAARDSHIPFHVGEGNSASCGGKEGVSDVFASALWALDTLLAVAEVGVSMWNFHGGPTSGWYSPIIFPNFPHNTIPEVRPLFYGMWASAAATQNGSLPWLYTIETSNPFIKAHVLKDASGTFRVAVIHKDLYTTDSTTVNVLPSAGYSGNEARLFRLLSIDNSATAKSGVTFAGQTFDGSQDGMPLGTPLSERVPVVNGLFSFTLAPRSAAILEYM